MKAIFKSKSGVIYDSADLALYDDAMHSDFQMFTKTGEPCEDIAICGSVWCPTPESVAQFAELSLSAKHFLDIHFSGSVREGLNRYDDCMGEWLFVGPLSAMADMSVTILNYIARMKKEGR